MNAEDLAERVGIRCSTLLPKAPNAFTDLLEKVVFTVSRLPRGSHPRAAAASRMAVSSS